MEEVVRTETKDNVMRDDLFIINTMTWSYSRLESFYNCKAAWKRKYIDCEDGDDNAFAQYGSASHKVLERYLKDEIGMFEMADEYDKLFGEYITEDFPYNKTADLAESYYYKGRKYFEEFTEVFPCMKDTLGVEMKLNFEIDHYQFVGYIDLLATDNDGNLIVVDHKSATSKFKKNGEPTKAFAEKMEGYKRQLYLYCKALIDQGMHPDYLCWNFFNDQKVYKIPFDFEEYKKAIEWAINTIHLIENEELFEEHEDFYFCHNICEFRRSCTYGIQEKHDESDVEFNAWQPEVIM